MPGVRRGAERNAHHRVVLNCPDWFDEAARLMDRAFQRYESVTMLNAGESLRTLPVAHSGGASVHAVLAAVARRRHAGGDSKHRD